MNCRLADALGPVVKLFYTFAMVMNPRMIPRNKTPIEMVAMGAVVPKQAAVPLKINEGASTSSFLRTLFRMLPCRSPDLCLTMDVN